MGNKLFFEKRGFLLFPTILSIFIIGMLGLALSTIYGNMFSTLSAGKSASQSQQFAEIEAEYLKLQGYDEADNLVHTWKTMEDFVGDDDGKNWESRLENIRTVNTASGDKVKIFKISTRKFGDVTSRYSLEVPLSSQSGYVPVGSVITWPSSNLPEWMTHGDYLECNGQTFDTTKYPRLYKALGTNHVPDYRGVFLRGYGTYDGKHSSSDIGVVQGDATIEYKTWATGFFDGQEFDMPDQGTTVYWHTFHSYSIIEWRDVSHDPIRAKIYKYRLNPGSVSTSTDSKGNTSVSYSPPSLIEESYDMSYGYMPYTGWIMSNRKVAPIADEIRPINVAVKYFIKAR